MLTVSTFLMVVLGPFIAFIVSALLFSTARHFLKKGTENVQSVDRIKPISFKHIGPSGMV